MVDFNPPKPFKEKQLNKSKGILDDYAVRKNIASREGTITKTPVVDIDIANKKYVDENAGGASITQSNYTGSDTTGSDGNVNRTLESNSCSMAFINGLSLHLNIDYTYAGTTITFLNALWDDQAITIIKGIGMNNYTGADTTGLNGGTNRTLDVKRTFKMLFINGIFLHLDVDYTLTGTTITFLNNLWDEQYIAVY